MLKDWPVWMKKVIAFSNIESKSRAAIRNLIEELNESKKNFSNTEGINYNASVIHAIICH